MRVLDEDQQKSIPIVDNKSSLMSVLSNFSLYAVRLYVLLSEEHLPLREKIRETSSPRSSKRRRRQFRRPSICSEVTC